MIARCTNDDAVVTIDPDPGLDSFGGLIRMPADGSLPAGGVMVRFDGEFMEQER